MGTPRERSFVSFVISGLREGGGMTNKTGERREEKEKRKSFGKFRVRVTRKVFEFENKVEIG